MGKDIRPLVARDPGVPLVRDESRVVKILERLEMAGLRTSRRLSRRSYNV
jgi:hypothetical protein